jgi:hypothetical protein
MMRPERKKVVRSIRRAHRRRESYCTVYADLVLLVLLVLAGVYLRRDLPLKTRQDKIRQDKSPEEAGQDRGQGR